MRAAFALFPILAACGDGPTLVKTNTDPVVLLSSHEDGQVIEAPGFILFTAIATDPESPHDDLIVDWKVDTESVCPDAVIDDGDVSQCEVELDGGEHVITVTVIDPDGARADDRVAVEVEIPNVPPTCGFTSPDLNDAFALGEPIVFTALARDPDGDNEDLQATLTSSIAGPIASSRPTTAGELTFTTSDLTIDSHVMRLNVIDPDGDTCTDTLTISVVSPPEIVLIEPEDELLVDLGTTVRFEAEVTDDDGAITDATITWATDLDGTFASGAPDATGESVVFYAPTQAGRHRWSAEVTDATGLTARAERTLVVNGPPTAPGIDIAPTNPVTGDGLEVVLVTESVDPEGDPITYDYSWTRDGNVANTNPTVAADTVLRGEVWTVTVVPHDGRIAGPATTATVTIGNVAPTASRVSITPTSPITGDMLNADAVGFDPDHAVLDWTYTWTIDTTVVQSGPLSTLLEPVFRGQLVTVEATASDGLAMSAPATDGPLLVGNGVPSIEQVDLEASSPGADAVFTCLPSGWSDAEDDIPGYQWAWFVDGVQQPGLTDATTPPGVFSSGDAVRCEATPDDGISLGTPVSSFSITLGNTPPSAPGVRVTPAASDTREPLLCSVTTASVDPDADAVDYTFTWTVDGVAYTGTTSATVHAADTIPAGAVQPGTWVCTVTPSDGTDDGPTGSDDARVVAPFAPQRLTAGAEHTCVVVTGGEVLCWGASIYGQLGQGTTNPVGDDVGELATAPTVTLPAPARSVYAGPTHTCALTTTEDLYCWGDNTYGQLGIGSNETLGDDEPASGSLVAVDLGGDFRIAHVELGAHHACALSSDGRLKCWGRNDRGQLGLGDAFVRGDSSLDMGSALPAIDLGEDLGAIDIGVGTNQTCALLSDDTVKCWGAAGPLLGPDAQTEDLGDQSLEMGDQLDALELGTGALVDLQVAHRSACVRAASGFVRCWGDNDTGQLGVGDLASRGGAADELGAGMSPVVLGAGGTATATWLADGWSCARRDDGDLVCWGNNASGQHGEPSDTLRGDDVADLGNALAPLSLHASKSVTELALGTHHGCALLECGDVQCWGDNSFGYLGVADTRARGDDPEEMGDALPLAKTGGRYANDPDIDPAVCTPWSRTLQIDGNDSDWHPDEVFESTAGSGAALMVSWDDTYVYLGTRHPDVLAGTSEHWFVSYFGNGTDRAAVVSEPAFDFGVPHNTQQPTLAVASQYMARFQATLGFDQLAAAHYPAATPLWEGGAGALTSGADGIQIARDAGNQVIELRIPRDRLQLHEILYLQTTWLFEGAGFESTFAAAPNDMYNDGEYDPDFETYFRFELDHAAGPGAAEVLTTSW